jgi:RluA family pseudouridine synthase
MTPAGFEILYENGPVLVVDKPAGVATQAPLGIDSLEVRIRRFLEQRIGQPGGGYLGLPHRLDRAVSGAMVFATHIRAARRLSKQFERRQVEKTYWALVEGEADPPEGTWRDILWKIHGQPRAVVVDESHPQGQPAVLHYRTLGRHALGSWLEIRLETGRTHQIRVQAASRGLPILGDAHYGSRLPFGEQFADERLRAIALHARSLGFVHPITREAVSIEAPLPAAWEETLGKEPPTVA